MIWLFCLISFIIGCLATYFLSLRYIRRVLKKEKRSYRNEMKHTVKFWYLKPFPIVEVLKQHKDIYRIKEDKLDILLREVSRKLEKNNQNLKNHQSRVEALEKENGKLRNLVKNSGNVQKPSTPEINQGEGKKQLIMTHRNRSISLYFSIPEADGSFYAEKGESVPDDRKFYRIIYAADSETGELNFISGHYDQKAIENIDYYLVPVCEVENISQRNSASKVFQKEAGRVVKISGKWVTDKKIKVKLA
jgi:hypothetical protein